MLLRCTLDGLLLPAHRNPATGDLLVCDGDEGFNLEAVEALYYELVAASAEEALALEPRYRMLRKAADFCFVCPSCPWRLGAC